MIGTELLAEAKRRAYQERRPSMLDSFARLAIDYDAVIVEMKLARAVYETMRLRKQHLVHAAFLEAFELGVRAARLELDGGSIHVRLAP